MHCRTGVGSNNAREYISHHPPQELQRRSSQFEIERRYDIRKWPSRCDNIRRSQNIPNFGRYLLYETLGSEGPVGFAPLREHSDVKIRI